MKHNLLLAFSLITMLYCSTLMAQTTATDTYIVIDKTSRMASCVDSLITLEDIFQRTGIRDLNDATDNVGNYRMLALNGSLITETVIPSPIKYSDYESIYIEKTNTTFNGHNGVVIYFDLIERPTGLFIKDTLKFTVEKGAKVSYTKDFFENYSHWSSGMDAISLQDRIFFVDEATNNMQTMVADNWTLGKGNYKVKISVAVCRPDDIMWDSISVIVNETPCHHIEIKNQPSVCFSEVFDITPHVFIDGEVATAAQLEDITFWDRSNVFDQASGLSLDPESLNMEEMLNRTDRTPNMEITYQPNTDLGVCTNYQYSVSTKVPAKFISTDALFVKDNGGTLKVFQVDGDYYGFNNEFKTEILNKLYLDYFDVLDGTEFKFYSDYEKKIEETSTILSPGQYTAVAVNPACAYDSTFFNINIKNRDFDIYWKSAQTYGKGYYTFTVPTYSGATYAWSVWGGSIISGNTSDQVLVYFSEEVSPAVLVSCRITLPNARITGGGTLASALYFDFKDETLLEDEGTITSFTKSNTIEASAFPNPTSAEFTINGTGTYQVRIYNSLGEMVYQNEEYIANSPLYLTSKGIHIIHLTQKGKTQTLKHIIQK